MTAMLLLGPQDKFNRTEIKGINEHYFGKRKPESHISVFLAFPLTGNLAFGIESDEETKDGTCDRSRVSEGWRGEVHLRATDRARVRPRRLGRENCGPRRVTGNKFRLACPSAPAAAAAERRCRTVRHR